MAELFERATDPKQYDNPKMRWDAEGGRQNFIRRLFLERLSPFIADVAGKDVLDVGCGQGWLCDELDRRGARVLGIEPSDKNIASARRQYPELNFVQNALHTFEAPDDYDLVTGIMVFEHLPSLVGAFQKIKNVLRDQGRLLMITADFDKFTTPRQGSTLRMQAITDGMVASRTDYGKRAGISYDVLRRVDHFQEAAYRTGFKEQAIEPISAPDWLVAEQPRYAQHEGRPLFQLFDLMVG